MTTISQLRAMLLEEAVLALLRQAGYRAVGPHPADPTVRAGPAGLEVMGRGEAHQVGAVADLALSLPFTLPQRLLLEAKCYADGTPLGLAVVRQAAGLWRDVDENWLVTGRPAGQPKPRFAYHYALLSTSGFSAEAENYALAQNIHLLQLDGMPHFSPLLAALLALNHNHFKATAWNAIRLPLAELRQVMRTLFEGRQDERLLRLLVPAVAVKPLLRVVRATVAVPGFTLGLIGRHLTVPLLFEQEPAAASGQVWHFQREAGYWTLRSGSAATAGFSLNLSTRLVRYYAGQALFPPDSAVEATIVRDGTVRFLTLPLVAGWAEAILTGAG